MQEEMDKLPVTQYPNPLLNSCQVVMVYPNIVIHIILILN